MYEYAVVGGLRIDTSILRGIGYIASGIEVPAKHDRGNLLLLIDSTLTCTWSGRPYWLFHTMGMGEPIGKSALLSENNQSYDSAAFSFGVHVALMGDPTLRMRYRDISTPENIAIHQIAARQPYVEIDWEGPEAPDVTGYYVYRQVEGGEEELLTLEPITETMYQDTALFGRTVTYTIRATTLVESPSGTYYELGNKATWTSEIVANVNEPIALSADFSMRAGPNPTRESVTLNLELEARSDVEITVWNVNGVRVKTLETRTLAPGGHSYIWDRTDAGEGRVPAGVYLFESACRRCIEGEEGGGS